MPIDTTWSFSVQSEANDDWILASDLQSDHEALDYASANGGYWVWTDQGSPSGQYGTGPPDGVPCIYPETSSPSQAGDEFTCTLRSAINASLYNINVEFDLETYGDSNGTIYFEAFNGSTWDIIDSWNGNSTTTFQAQGPYDLSSYENTDFKIRLRVVTGGTSYLNDFTWDEVRIYGSDKAAAEIEQEGFRFYDDDGDEDESTALANQDTDISMAKETNFRLRILANATDDPDSGQFTLQYKRDDEAASEWRNV